MDSQSGTRHVSKVYGASVVRNANTKNWPAFDRNGKQLDGFLPHSAGHAAFRWAFADHPYAVRIAEAAKQKMHLESRARSNQNDKNRRNDD